MRTASGAPHTLAHTQYTHVHTHVHTPLTDTNRHPCHSGVDSAYSNKTT